MERLVLKVRKHLKMTLLLVSKDAKKFAESKIREKINLFTVGNRALREQLFSKQWNRGDILGPIVTDDNIIMFVPL